jgi:hypothetical protein
MQHLRRVGARNASIGALRSTEKSVLSAKFTIRHAHPYPMKATNASVISRGKRQALVTMYQVALF